MVGMTEVIVQKKSGAGSGQGDIHGECQRREDSEETEEPDEAEEKTSLHRSLGFFGFLDFFPANEQFCRPLYCYHYIMSRHVILVDEQNNQIGTMEIVAAHSGEGKLHRAFSVYVFSKDKSSLLIQQRSGKKMLFPLIWANTCCSHPFENEDMIAAGQRRLKEELGFSVALTAGPSFVYRAKDPDGKGSEYEHVTTLIGAAEKGIAVHPNADEVEAWKWIDIPTLLNDFEKYPNFFALWLKIGLQKILGK